MVGPLEFATIGAFAAGLDPERMMRPPHVALGGRGLSLWNRHGENTPWTKPKLPTLAKLQDGGGEKQGAELNRTECRMQERFQQEKASAFTCDSWVYQEQSP
jgi:hypothetical protein